MPPLSRRDFLARSAALSAGGLLAACARPGVAASTPHPHIFLTADPVPGLRSVDDVRAGIRSGRARALWQALLERADADRTADPLTPADPLPGRIEANVRNRNPDFFICQEAGRRVLRAALAHLVTGRPGYKDSALRQLDALFDPGRWPDWIDQAHLRFELPADLRTGMLGLDVALAYDWLHPALDAGERAAVLEGIDRRAVQPYLASIAQDPWWTRDKNNWLTVIVGGLGIAGMALGDDHPDAAALVNYARPRMQDYLTIYGPEGEFNESVAYGGATRFPVAHAMATRYHTRGADNPLARAPYPQTCRWTMYLTLPPGRVAAFGDAHPEAAPFTRYIAAVAAAARDPFLQWFYLQHPPEPGDPLEVLWYDPALEPEDPEGRLPRGRAFPANGGCISSRSSWDPRAAACVVYGKSGREENHEHNDVGQVCIDGYGERLIVDLGSPSSYPADFFDEGRWQYYNASILGHNVPMFGGEEQLFLERERGEPVDHARLRAISGRLVEAAFDDARGAAWTIDLSGAYGGGRTVHRTVVHLLPGVVAVYDRAALPKAEPISLRWHTIVPADPAPGGRFAFRNGRAALSGRVVLVPSEVEGSPGAPLALAARRHAYRPPYDRARSGDPLEARREPYLEATLHAGACRILTLFAVAPADAPPAAWGWFEDERRAFIDTPDGRAEVLLTGAALHVRHAGGGSGWEVDLRS